MGNRHHKKHILIWQDLLLLVIMTKSVWPLLLETVTQNLPWAVAAGLLLSFVWCFSCLFLCSEPILWPNKLQCVFVRVSYGGLQVSLTGFQSLRLMKSVFTLAGATGPQWLSPVVWFKCYRPNGLMVNFCLLLSLTLCIQQRVACRML